jgi:hypothetical protein
MKGGGVIFVDDASKDYDLDDDPEMDHVKIKAQFSTCVAA